MRCEEIQRHNVPFGRKSETGNHPLAARLKKRMIVFNSEGDMILQAGRRSRLPGHFAAKMVQPVAPFRERCCPDSFEGHAPSARYPKKR
jgi:hypothetical protein